MIDLSVAAIADTFESRNRVGEWWFIPLHGALAKLGFYAPPTGDDARQSDSRDGENVDRDETVHWL